jgi:hypothetical protein
VVFFAEDDHVHLEDVVVESYTNAAMAENLAMFAPLKPASSM